MGLQMSKGYIYLSRLFPNTLFWVLGSWLVVDDLLMIQVISMIGRDLYSWWTIFSYNLMDLSFIYTEFETKNI